MRKRAFLKSLGGISFAAVFGPGRWERLAALPPQRLAQDEAFWAAIRREYLLVPDYVNLENGYYSLLARPVLEAFVGRVREVNQGAANYMRTRHAADRLEARRRLAGLAGCPVEELIVTRNTTESLDTVIAGFDWRQGDEAVMARHDYGAMLDQFALMARRHGMVNRTVVVPNDPASDDEVVRVYEQAITPRTRLLMICHVVNITGQVLPVAAVADMARRRGVLVLVDGAHAFGQLDFRIPDLGADYYGASLHKWLGCPLGAGILWVRRDRIAGLWPLYSPGSIPDDDIRKLNHTGTPAAHTELAIQDAIAFHESLGIARKEARLRWLQRYWTDQVRGRPGIVLNTPSDVRRTCAIANVAVRGHTPESLAQALMERYRIYTVAIDRPGAEGVRVTPHLFTTAAELDGLVRALRALAA